MFREIREIQESISGFVKAILAWLVFPACYVAPFSSTRRKKRNQNNKRSHFPDSDNGGDRNNNNEHVQIFRVSLVCQQQMWIMKNCHSCLFFRDDVMHI